MKIIYIVNARIPTEKAHGYQIAKMCEEFARAGAEVELWASARNNPIKEDVFSYYGLERRFAVKYIKSFDFIARRKYLGRRAIYWQILCFLLRLLSVKPGKDRLVYTRNPEIAWFFKMRGYKTVYECHDWFGKNKKIALWFLRRCDLIVTTNKFIKKEFIERSFPPDRLLVAPNGINLDIFAINDSRKEALRKISVDAETRNKLDGRKTLLYTGSFRTMNREKGIATILGAMRASGGKPPFFIAVGGNRTDIDYYRKVAEEMGLGQECLFAGRVGQVELAAWQRAADLLLMPFPRAAHYEYFMTPLKMFEYMAGGRPIIASDLPSIREILNDDNAFFCKPGDADDLARVIGYVLACPEEAKRKAGRARRDAEQYTWAKRADKILNYIER